MAMNLEASNYRSVTRGLMKGYFVLTLTDCGLNIRNMGHYCNGGDEYVILPGAPRIIAGNVVMKEGKPQYFPVIDFDTTEDREAFCRAALAALKTLLRKKYQTSSKAAPSSPSV